MVSVPKCSAAGLLKGCPGYLWACDRSAVMSVVALKRSFCLAHGKQAERLSASGEQQGSILLADSNNSASPTADRAMHNVKI